MNNGPSNRDKFNEPKSRELFHPQSGDGCSYFGHDIQIDEHRSAFHIASADAHHRIRERLKLVSAKQFTHANFLPLRF